MSRELESLAVFSGSLNGGRSGVPPPLQPIGINDL